MHEWYFEDYEKGRPYMSPPHTITEDEAVEFARVYDPQYFHLDPVAARDSAFGELVCAGFHTVALSWALVLRTGMFDHSARAGIGVDELRWLAPVRPGDTVRLRFTLLDGRVSHSKPRRAVATFFYEMFNQLDDVVLTLKMIQSLKRRSQT